MGIKCGRILALSLFHFSSKAEKFCGQRRTHYGKCMQCFILCGHRTALATSNPPEGHVPILDPDFGQPRCLAVVRDVGTLQPCPAFVARR